MKEERIIRVTKEEILEMVNRKLNTTYNDIGISSRGVVIRQVENLE